MKNEIRLVQVKKLTGLSHNSIYQPRNDSCLQNKINLGEHSAKWVNPKICDWTIERRNVVSRASMQTDIEHNELANIASMHINQDEFTEYMDAITADLSEYTYSHNDLQTVFAAKGINDNTI